MLVGIGPGQSEWRTPEASQMILGADELVGYDLYIDLLGAVVTYPATRLQAWRGGGPAAATR